MPGMRNGALLFVALAGTFAAAAGSHACIGEAASLPTCDPARSFGKPEPLSELALGSSRDVDFVLAGGDENLAYFTSIRPQGGDIYAARRKNRATLFENVAPVAGVSLPTELEFRPLVSQDGNTMHFARISQNKWRLFRSSRSAGGAAFEAGTEIVIKFSDGRIAEPACPWIDRTGATLYFSEGTDTPGAGRVYVGPLDGSGPPALISELLGYECIVVSADETEAFVRKHVAKDSNKMVYRSTRAGGSTWSEPALVPELTAANAVNEVTYVSKNHCDVYLSSTRDGAPRIYWGKREPSE
jgi:hypothetical protein